MTWTELEHTADMGLRIEAPCMEELLEECRLALYSYLPRGVPDRTATGETRDIRIEAVDLEDLFIRWLNELIYIWDSDLSIFVPISVLFQPEVPRLSVSGRLIRNNSGGCSPFKAATYGGALLKKGPPAVLTVYFDV